MNPSRNKTLLALMSLAAAVSLQAQSLYWDTDSGTGGIQGGNGTWNSSTYWNPASDGTGTAQNWTASANAHFTATDANSSVDLGGGTYAVTNFFANTGTKDTYKRVTLTNGTLNVSGNMTVGVDQAFSGTTALGNISLVGTSGTQILSFSGGFNSSSETVTGNLAAGSNAFTIAGDGGNGTGLMIVSLNISGTEDITWTMIGNGGLKGDNASWTGNLNVNSTGIVKSFTGGNGSVSTALSAANVVTFSQAGTLDAFVNKLIVGGLTGSTGFVTRSHSSGSFEVNVADGQSYDFGGSIVNASAGMNVTKSGNGTQAFSGTGSYTGTTTVSGGTLIIDGDFSSATGNVTVNSGATLGGSGTIGGDTTISSGGFLNPGNSPGVQTFEGALTLNGTTTMELGGTTRGTEYDGINVGGLLTYGGDLDIVNWNGFDIDGTNFTYDLFQIDPTNSYTGNFASVSVGAVSLSNNAGVWTGSNGTIDYTFDISTGDLIVIPEPSSLALLGLAGVAVMMGLRRRRG